MFRGKLGIFALFAVALTMAEPAFAQPATACEAPRDVTSGGLLGCWNNFDQDHSFDIVPGVYDEARQDEYRRVIASCRTRPEIRQNYCEMARLELALDAYFLSYARNLETTGRAVDPATGARRVMPRFSAYRVRYYGFRGRGTRSLEATLDVQFTAAAVDGVNFAEDSICGGARSPISAEMRAAVARADELLRAQPADRYGSAGPTAYSVVSLFQEAIHDRTGPRCRRGSTTCFTDADLLSMYQLAMAMNNTYAADPAAPPAYPAIRSASFITDPSTGLCARIHSAERARREAIAASTAESLSRATERVSDAGVSQQEFMQLLDFAYRDAGPNGGMRRPDGTEYFGLGVIESNLLGSSVARELIASAGTASSSSGGGSSGPALTGGSRSGAACDFTVTGLPESGVNGTAWRESYDVARSFFDDSWETCVREGMAPSVAAESGDGEASTAAESVDD